METHVLQINQVTNEILLCVFAYLWLEEPFFDLVRAWEESAEALGRSTSTGGSHFYNKDKEIILCQHFLVSLRLTIKSHVLALLQYWYLTHGYSIVYTLKVICISCTNSYNFFYYRWMWNFIMCNIIKVTHLEEIFQTWWLSFLPVAVAGIPGPAPPPSAAASVCSPSHAASPEPPRSPLPRTPPAAVGTTAPAETPAESAGTAAPPAVPAQHKRNRVRRSVL